MSWAALGGLFEDGRDIADGVGLAGGNLHDEVVGGVVRRPLMP